MMVMGDVHGVVVGLGTEGGVPGTRLDQTSPYRRVSGPPVVCGPSVDPHPSVTYTR